MPKAEFSCARHRVGEGLDVGECPVPLLWQRPRRAVSAGGRGSAFGVGVAAADPGNREDRAERHETGLAAERATSCGCAPFAADERAVFAVGVPSGAGMDGDLKKIILALSFFALLLGLPITSAKAAVGHYRVDAPFVR